ncbi:hypothetical protein GCM10022406_39880 [Hymenobacter algoricola]|uniref:Uncharacterized protein n=1 Tax=Hymenobacter algoricola TaxID=486267 RepID=A0ABP7NUB9_9BACT
MAAQDGHLEAGINEHVGQAGANEAGTTGNEDFSGHGGGAASWTLSAIGFWELYWKTECKLIAISQ